MFTLYSLLVPIGTEMSERTKEIQVTGEMRDFLKNQKGTLSYNEFLFEIFCQNPREPSQVLTKKLKIFVCISSFFIILPLTFWDQIWNRLINWWHCILSDLFILKQNWNVKIDIFACICAMRKLLVMFAHFYIATCYTKMDKTAWTHSISYNLRIRSLPFPWAHSASWCSILPSPFSIFILL
mgnify:CR=1 FL=1